MKWGLILAGGGTRGSYHLGVWKALKTLGIDIGAVTGTSIGAINGALLAQGEYESVLKMWESISLSDIIKLPDEMAGQSNVFDIRNFPAIAREIRSNNGLDTSPLAELLKSMIDEDSLRNSPIDFGLVTYSLTEKAGVTMFCEDIPKGEMVDYIMASAALPVFKRVTIDGEDYADGAFYDNRPAGMLTERGYTNIISVDVKGAGIVRSFNNLCRNIRTIAPKKSAVGSLDFNPEGIAGNISMGYYDTLEEFGVYSGSNYYITSDSYARAKRMYSADIISGLESAAMIFGIDTLEGYEFEDLKQQALKCYNEAALRYDFEGDANIFEKIRLKTITDEKFILTWLVYIMKNGKADMLESKIVRSILGHYGKAANTIGYMLTS